ncbi:MULTISPECIES: AEC family transporter [unclassified Lentimonas]|uniref:AEC family transporter n=1 Tax=unclassified Lentimonas TaxID=2630993 RepID=UPI001324F15F|nr:MULTISPECIES: AEC family transporter [unclassified Lentimonas]CAA6693874.1 Unannotated [Lentimonas sp. CC19]CAA6695189.1 Unannotated [Lentimonas sp. CC10]CAA7069731.1 Unannotated [Lentimonas sp. CC11]
MLHVINTLTPVFLVIALGYYLGKKAILSESFLGELNRLLFRVCLPALIVHSMATATEIPEGTGIIILLFILATFAVIGLSIPASRLLRLPRARVGTFVQATFRGNLAYVGIPIILYALRDAPAETVASVIAQTMFVFAPAMVIYNVVSVFFLVSSHEASAGESLNKIVIQILKNPLILAALIGFCLYTLPFDLPRALLDTLQFTGQIAAPASLICVGGSMAFVSMEGRYRSALVATALKIVAVPTIAYLLATLFQVQGHSRLILLVLSATPTAVASYVMAKELHGDEALAAGSIILSTALSAVSLAVVIALCS